MYHTRPIYADINLWILLGVYFTFKEGLERWLECLFSGHMLEVALVCLRSICISTKNEGRGVPGAAWFERCRF